MFNGVKNTNKKALFLIVALLTTIGLSALFFTVQNKKQDDLVNNPEKAIFVIAGDILESALYKIQNHTLVPISSNIDGAVLGFAQNASGRSVVIVKPPETPGSVLYLYDDAQESGVELGYPDAIKATPAVSPDGNLIAFAKFITPASSSLYNDDIGQWHVVVYNIETKKYVDYGVGYRPYFVKDFYNNITSYLFFSTPEGLKTVSLENNKDSYVFDSIKVSNIHTASHLSPDEKTLAVFDDPSGKFNLFKVESMTPLVLTALPPIEGGYNVLTLSDTNFFGVVPITESSSSIVVFPFTNQQNYEELITFDPRTPILELYPSVTLQSY